MELLAAIHTIFSSITEIITPDDIGYKQLLKSHHVTIITLLQRYYNAYDTLITRL